MRINQSNHQANFPINPLWSTWTIHMSGPNATSASHHSLFQRGPMVILKSNEHVPTEKCKTCMSWFTAITEKSIEWGNNCCINNCNSGLYWSCELHKHPRVKIHLSIMSTMLQILFSLIHCCACQSCLKMKTRPDISILKASTGSKVPIFKMSHWTCYCLSDHVNAQGNKCRSKNHNAD